MLGGIALDESMIARFNRISERRARWFGHLIFATQPRWAFSLLAICMVLVTIVAFDRNPVAPTSSPLVLWRHAGLPAGVCLAIVGLTGAICLRDWRAFFASTFSPAFAVTLGAWLAYRTGLPPLDTLFSNYFPAWRVVALGTAAGAACSYAVTARIAVYRTFDTPLVEACEGAVREIGPPMIATCIAVGVLTMPGPVPAVAFLDGAGALLLTPAILAALETILPRRKSVEKLYGKKKVEPS
jgi:hypothetical protein